MTDMQERQSPPALPAVEADTLISGKIIGILKKIFYNGFPVAARFKTSLRVGSGANSLTGLDGFDGLITSDGVTAGYVFANRAGGISYGQLYRNGTVYQIDNEAAAHLWQWDSTQLAWAAPTLLNSWVNWGAGFNTAGYRKDHSGFVHLRGLVKNGSVVTGTVLFTLPTGFRPANATHIFAVSSGTAFGECRVDPAGNVAIQAGVNTYFSLDGIHFDTAA